MFTYFYHRTFRKLIVGFGTLFNNIYVAKYDASFVEKDRYKVPLAYGPKQKWLARLEQVNSPNNGTNDIQNQIAITLPRMAFQITNISYDSQRKTASTNSRTIPISNGTLGFRYERVPYNIEISLFLMTKSQDETLQVLEQILPYFSPDFNLTLQNIPGLDDQVDVPVTFNGLSMEDNYEGSFQERRVLISTLVFTAKAFIYGPVREQKIILDADVNFVDFDNDGFIMETLSVTPDIGITAGSIGLTSGYTVQIRTFLDDGLTSN